MTMKIFYLSMVLCVLMLIGCEILNEILRFDTHTIVIGGLLGYIAAIKDFEVFEEQEKKGGKE